MRVRARARASALALLFERRSFPSFLPRCANPTHIVRVPPFVVVVVPFRAETESTCTRLLLLPPRLACNSSSRLRRLFDILLGDTKAALRSHSSLPAPSSLPPLEADVSMIALRLFGEAATYGITVPLLFSDAHRSRDARESANFVRRRVRRRLPRCNSFPGKRHEVAICWPTYRRFILTIDREALRNSDDFNCRLHDWPIRKMCLGERSAGDEIIGLLETPPIHRWLPSRRNSRFRVLQFSSRGAKAARSKGVSNG